MKDVSIMSSVELVEELKLLDQTYGTRDPDGRKAQIRRELIRRNELHKVTGIPIEVLKRNPLIRKDFEAVEAEQMENI